MPKFILADVEQKLEEALFYKSDQVKLELFELSALIAAYKQLNYQRKRRDVAKVTETDQNPA